MLQWFILIVLGSMNAMTSVEPAVYALAQLNLDTGSHTLSGPRGHVMMPPRPYRVLERLMRRPGALVTVSDLVAAMYPDDEPDSAENGLRQQILRLRNVVHMIAGDSVVWIRTEVGVGYAIDVRRPRAPVMMERA